MPDDRRTGHLSLRTTGGIAHFPRAAEPGAVAFRDLGDHEIASIVAAVERADFFDRPDQPAPQHVRDARTHHLGVEIDHRSRVLAVHEPIGDDALAALVRIARELICRRSRSD